jgi:hypothetical protein
MLLKQALLCKIITVATSMLFKNSVFREKNCSKIAFKSSSFSYILLKYPSYKAIFPDINFGFFNIPIATIAIIFYDVPF